MDMCSISGISGFHDFVYPYRANMLMGNSLGHRGPDQKGYCGGNCYCFAHNRLAVIDVERGKQPMMRTHRGADYTIVYNGELYNTEEIKRDLVAKGYLFETHCDTEVVLFAYIEWGEDCVQKFNGIFAFAIFDERRNFLFLARDRFGVKPLFYTIKNNTLIFASEIKGILAHPAVKPVINQESIWQLLLLCPTRPATSGIFKDIYELPPASYAIYSERGLFIKKYWELVAQEHTDDPDKTIRTVRELFLDTVKRQLVSDVPLCCFLSGGLDSSAVSAIAALESPHLSTYSFEYEGNDKYFKPTSFQPNSDVEYAFAVAQTIGSAHTVLTATSEDITSLLKDAVIARDFPGMADIDSSLLYYCRQVKQKHTVALSGECADEVFGGYPWFVREEMLKSSTFPWLHSASMRGGIFNPDFIRLEQGSEYVQDIYSQSVAECPCLPNENEHELLRRRSSWLSINWFMASLLERKDRMSMASSLEVRVPFADHRLVEYVYNVPWTIKQRNGVEKALLRDAMIGIVPENVLHRKKSPYPKTHNPGYEDKVKKLLNERMNDPHSILKRIIHQESLTETLKGENITWFGQLMSRPQLIGFLLQLDFWFDEYKIEIE